MAERRRWRRSCRAFPGALARSEANGPCSSVALEVVEGFQAGVAARERLAWRRAERAGQPNLGRAAMRALEPGRRLERRAAPRRAAADLVEPDRLLRGTAERRRDAVVAQLALAVVADPVSGPRGRDARLEPHAMQAAPLERLNDVARNDLRGRAARVGRRDRDGADP